MKIPRKAKKQPKINTTALPDIIFMLLFFFMVTTTMQNQNMQTIELPAAFNVDFKSKSNPNDLEIYLLDNSIQNMLKVNDETGNLGNYKQLINHQVSLMKQNGIFVNRAYMYIDENTPMSTVNKVKEELQELNILKISYIHNYESES